MRGFNSVIWRFAVLCVAGVVPQKIHEEMTASERMQVFGTIDENVQDYEIASIYWPRVQKRSTDGGIEISLKAFGEDIKLSLLPTDGVLFGDNTPMYILKSLPDGYKLFEKYVNVIEELQLYENMKYHAALAVWNGGNRRIRSIIGTIESKNLTIAPIPERLLEEVRRGRTSLDKIPPSEEDNHHYHIISKMSPDRSETLSKRPQLPLAHLNRTPTQSSAQFPPKPDTVYPEILVVVNHGLYEILGKKVDYAVAYMVAFWYGVDLKYRSLRNPKFRLNIAAIVLTADADALGFPSETSPNEITNETLYAHADFWYYAKHIIPVDSYDVLVTMVPNALCPTGPANICSEKYTGVAWVGGACYVNHDKRQMQKVGIVADRGVFNGIHTAAHELGHLFGAKHDGKDHKECPELYGHIMAPHQGLTARSSQWSTCSLNDMQEFMDSQGQCLYNKPNHNGFLNVPDQYVPGNFLSDHQRCQQLGQFEACEAPYRVCQELHCRTSKGCVPMGSPTTDGTKCGYRMFCLNGQCIRP